MTNAKSQEKDVGPFTLQSYCNKVVFHSKSHAKMSELRTKESDPELIFFFMS